MPKITDATTAFFCASALVLSLNSSLALAEDKTTTNDPLKDDIDAAAELAREGADRLLRALSAFFESIPQYAAPEINENGDIIIRRLNPDNDKSEGNSKKPDMEETSST